MREGCLRLQLATSVTATHHICATALCPPHLYNRTVPSWQPAANNGCVGSPAADVLLLLAAPAAPAAPAVGAPAEKGSLLGCTTARLKMAVGREQVPQSTSSRLALWLVAVMPPPLPLLPPLLLSLLLLAAGACLTS